MADLKALRAELDADPLAWGYKGAGHTAVADQLNAKVRTQYVDVSVAEVAGYVELFGLYTPLQAATTNEAAQSLLRMIRAETPVTALIYSDPAKRPAIDNLLDGLADVIGAQHVEALRSMGVRTISRAEELNLLGRSDKIGPAHVAKAWSL